MEGKVQKTIRRVEKRKSECLDSDNQQQENDAPNALFVRPVMLSESKRTRSNFVQFKSHLLALTDLRLRNYQKTVQRYPMHAPLLIT